MLQKCFDNFEIECKHANFWLGMQFPLKCTGQTDCTTGLDVLKLASVAHVVVYFCEATLLFKTSQHL